jgi:heat-inducible transcriptional repressor
MADLEALGYLDHPHTSAGRIPTDEGYRLYVDSLMRHRDLAPAAAAAIRSELLPRDGSVDQVIGNASHLLSRLSRHVGFVLAPDIAATSFRHIDLVALAHPRVLVVMVSATGIVTNKVVEVEEKLSSEDLQACANYLNANYSGQTLSAIRAQLLDLMKEEKALYDSLLQKVVALGERAFAVEEGEASVYLDGTASILEHVGDVERMRALFRTFEEKSRLVKILNACLSGEGIRILIGHENPDPGLRDLALVTARCPVEGEAGWGLGVLGSTRMEYAHVVALVDHVSRAVSDVLRGLRS